MSDKVAAHLAKLNGVAALASSTLGSSCPAIMELWDAAKGDD